MQRDPHAVLERILIPSRGFTNPATSISTILSCVLEGNSDDPSSLGAWGGAKAWLAPGASREERNLAVCDHDR